MLTETITRNAAPSPPGPSAHGARPRHPPVLRESREHCRALLESRCSHEGPYVLAPVSRVTTCHYMFHMLSIAGGRLVFSPQDARALTPAGTRRLVPFPYSPPSTHLEPSEAFVNKLRRGFLLRAVLPRQLFQKRLNIMVRMQGPSPLAYCMAVFDEAEAGSSDAGGSR